MSEHLIKVALTEFSWWPFPHIYLFIHLSHLMYVCVMRVYVEKVLNWMECVFGEARTNCVLYFILYWFTFIKTTSESIYLFVGMANSMGTEKSFYSLFNKWNVINWILFVSFCAHQMDANTQTIKHLSIIDFVERPQMQQIYKFIMNYW